MISRTAAVHRFFLLALTVLAAMFALPGCQKYDELIEKDQVCLQKWADLDADLQRRADLVPNLVNTVKAAANYGRRACANHRGARLGDEREALGQGPQAIRPR